jgi:hypothetical protein
MKRWTDEEDRYLVQAVASGEKVLSIAHELGRTEWACYARLRLLRRAGVQVPDPREVRQLWLRPAYVERLNRMIAEAHHARRAS